jgi:hypothetical protein
MTDKLDTNRFLTTAQVAAALDGLAPEPFVVGRKLEIVMDTGRLVRGEVVGAGAGAAQIVPYWVDPWKDQHGEWHEAYPRVLIIVYAQVDRWADAEHGAEPGNWNPQHPDYQKEMAASGGSWHRWPNA